MPPDCVVTSQAHVCTGCEFCKSLSPLDRWGENPYTDGAGTAGAHGPKRPRSRPFPSHIRPGVPRIFLTAPLSSAAVGFPHDCGEKLLATENSPPVHWPRHLGR